MVEEPGGTFYIPRLNRTNSIKITGVQIMRWPMNLRDNVLASLYLYPGGFPCHVIHPVCSLQIINESFAKTGSHVFHLKK